MDEDRGSTKSNRLRGFLESWKKIGLSKCWYDLLNDRTNIKILTASSKQRCNDIFRQQAFSKMSLFSSLMLYNKIKDTWDMEEYVSMGSNKEITGLAWLRLGIWRLRGLRKKF